MPDLSVSGLAILWILLAVSSVVTELWKLEEGHLIAAMRTRRGNVSLPRKP